MVLIERGPEKFGQIKFKFPLFGVSGSDKVSRKVNHRNTCGVKQGQALRLSFLNVVILCE